MSPRRKRSVPLEERRSPEFCICSECGRTVGAVVPRGGDGSGVWPRAHSNPAGVRCDGRFYEAKWVGDG